MQLSAVQRVSKLHRLEPLLLHEWSLFYDHRGNFSRGTWNFRGFSPLNIQGYTLKVKGNFALPNLDNAVWTEWNALIHCSLNSSKMCIFKSMALSPVRIRISLWVWEIPKFRFNWITSVNVTNSNDNSPFCSFTLGGWNLLTWLDSASEPLCWRSDARRNNNGRIIWMSGGWRSQSAVDRMVCITTHMRRLQDSSAVLDAFGEDRRRVEST